MSAKSSTVLEEVTFQLEECPAVARGGKCILTLTHADTKKKAFDVMIMKWSLKFRFIFSSIEPVDPIIKEQLD